MLVGGVCGIAGVVSGKDNVLDKFMSKKKLNINPREDLQDQYTPCTNEQQEEIDD